MAFHVGIPSTFGITLGSNVIPQDARKIETVGVSEVVGVNGEYVKADPLKTKKVDVSISGVGAANAAGVTSEIIANPGTLKILRVSQGEKSTGDQRATFTLDATGMEAFVDEEGEGEGAGTTVPTADTLGIVSVTLSLVESLDVSTEVTDLNASATSGVPGARATCMKKNTISLRGKGDLPPVTLGTSGVGVRGLTGGKMIVTKLEQGSKASDINDWAIDATNYPSAA